jgi:hypothetical protein
MVHFLEQLLRRTLNSVIFGIAVMALIALYVAVGSGFPAVREAFEMNEMQFFNAWPLKVLVALLVMNLAVVTWIRIPFTPPRYGVWCVHAGIVVLVLGMAYHYTLKTEGLTRIFREQAVEHYYDLHERALYAQAGVRRSAALPLESLPRFKSYSEAAGNASALDRSDLRRLSLVVPGQLDPATGHLTTRPLAEELGLPDLTIDILEYYPYAQVRFDGFVEDPSVTNVGLKLTPLNLGEQPPQWLVASEPQRARISFENVEIEHRHFPSADVMEALQAAVSQIHQVSVKVGEFSTNLVVEPGKSYPLGPTGYTLEVLSFVPNWTTADRSKQVAALLLKVRSPAGAQHAEFHRMVLDGMDVQTDFDTSDMTGGPLGKRQTTPLDGNLVVGYRYNDTLRLLPTRAAERRLLITADGKPGITEVSAAVAAPSRVTPLDVANPRISVTPAAPGPLGTPVDPAPPVEVSVQRFDHLRAQRTIEEIPSNLRDRDLGAAGVMQIVKVRLTSGEWSRELFVPFEQWAADVLWQGEQILIPGARAPLELRIGNTVRGMPARIRLDRFEVTPYPGGDVSASSIMRDFKSHLTISDRSGKTEQGEAHMNNPFYFDNGTWLFYQAQWDPEGQTFTVLGVGNRPGVWTMTLGCIMIGVGLLWAFYLKPIIIRRMKEQALRKAAAAKAGASASPGGLAAPAGVART